MLTTGHQDTRQDRMSSRTRSGAVATVCLARDDRRTEHALGQIIRGIQFVDIQETQQMRTMLSQALGKAVVIPITQSAFRSDQCVQTCPQSFCTLVLYPT